jgi:hypothetical protein
MKNPKGRKPSPKRDQIVVAWATEKGNYPELMYFHNGNWQMKRDINMLMSAFGTQVGIFGRTLVEELTERGYDLSTFRFSIEKLPQDPVAAPAEAGDLPADPFYRLAQ